MKHLTPFLIIIMLIVNQQSIFANDLYSLTVRVVDKDTNRGIEGVEVFIEEARIAKTILTNKDGYCEFPKIFPVGKIVIRTGKKYGYIPRVISATISPRIEDNNIVIELERSNNLIFFGQVRDKKGSYINNATCILKVGSDTEIMSSDSLGFFKHEMAHDRPKSNIAEMEVSAANFKSVSNKQTIQPNQLLYEFNVILKKKINEKKLTRAV